MFTKLLIEAMQAAWARWRQDYKLDKKALMQWADDGGRA